MIFEDEGFELTDDIRALIARVIDAAKAHEGVHGEVSVLITGDDQVHRLNREFRAVDSSTDVLSFPADAEAENFLGDIVISLPRARIQAEEYGHPLTRELCFLALHGALHLMGYDHIAEADARIMFARQAELLEGMGITR
jgi:probable rRNA maturation factor